jgi:hypothetical protein
MRWPLLVVLVMLTCGSCLQPLPPRPLIVTAVPIAPFPMWRRWWALTELCSGRTGNFDAVRWYYVPGWAFMSPVTRYDSVGSPRRDSTEVVGVSVRDGRTSIYLAESQLMSRGTVMHEMLHALGEDRHSMRVFVTQCHVESKADLMGEIDPVP